MGGGLLFVYSFFLYYSFTNCMLGGIFIKKNVFGNGHLLFYNDISHLRFTTLGRRWLLQCVDVDVTSHHITHLCTMMHIILIINSIDNLYDISL